MHYPRSSTTRSSVEATKAHTTSKTLRTYAQSEPPGQPSPTHHTSFQTNPSAILPRSRDGHRRSVPSPPLYQPGPLLCYNRLSSSYFFFLSFPSRRPVPCRRRRRHLPSGLIGRPEISFSARSGLCGACARVPWTPSRGRNWVSDVKPG